jgi:hypothetical protein
MPPASALTSQEKADLTFELIHIALTWEVNSPGSRSEEGAG